jgi:hypothetical protein
MAETAFETKLAGLYETSPAYPDGEEFLSGLMARLDREARLRGLVLGGMGMTGAAVATAAIARSGLLERLYGGMPPLGVAGIGVLVAAAAMAVGAMILAPVLVGSVSEA